MLIISGPLLSHLNPFLLLNSIRSMKNLPPSSAEIKEKYLSVPMKEINPQVFKNKIKPKVLK